MILYFNKMHFNLMQLKGFSLSAGLRSSENFSGEGSVKSFKLTNKLEPTTFYWWNFVKSDGGLLKDAL